jgi:ORF6N domain
MPKPKKSPKPIDDLIHTIRGQKVILDTDLAELYGVPVKRLNEQVKRNIERFPKDFMFQLSASEWTELRSMAACDESEDSDDQHVTNDRSQIATSSSEPSDSKRLTHLRRSGSSRPYAFTEHGAIMASTILSSPEAVRMSQYVVRAFIKQREFLMANADLLKRLAEIDAKLLNHDEVLKLIIQELQPLLNPPATPALPDKEMGFHVREEPPAYGVVSIRKISKKNDTVKRKKA